MNPSYGLSFIHSSKLSFTNEVNCFISFPRKLLPEIKEADGAVFLIESVQNGQQLFVTWSGKYSLSNDVEISGLFATLNSLTSNDEVMIYKCPKTNPCEKLSVEPLIHEEEELIHLHQYYIEQNLLRLIRVVTPNLIIPITISTDGNLVIKVKVSAIFPREQCLVLQEMTEVHLGPILEPVEEVKKNLFGGIVETFSNLIGRQINNVPEIQSTSDSSSQQQIICHIKSKCSHTLFRVIQRSVVEEDKSWNTIYIHSSTFEATRDDHLKVAKMKIIISPESKAAKTDTNDTKIPERNLFEEEHFSSTYVNVKVIHNCGANEIILCPTLQRQLGLQPGNCVTLSPVSDASFTTLKPNFSVTLIPLSLQHDTKELLMEQFSAHLMINGPCIVAHGTLISFGCKDFLVSIDDNPFSLLAKTSVIELSLGNLMLGKIKTRWAPFLPLNEILHIPVVNSKREHPPGYGDLFEDLLTSIYSTWSNHFPTETQNILLCGPRGSGKSLTVKLLRQSLTASEYQPYIHVIDCKSLRGKRSDTLIKLLSKELAKCHFSQPSILILEDIDCIISNLGREETGPELLQSHRTTLSLMLFWTFIRDQSKYSKVVLLSTAKEIESLHETIVPVRGNFFFSETFTLLPPNEEQRMEILEYLFAESSHLCNGPNFELKTIPSTELEGYSPEDIQILVKRIIHEEIKKTAKTKSSRVVVQRETFEDISRRFRPLSLRGVSFKAQSSKKLLDVGGLSDVKAILLETLLWPIKYPEIYSKIPIHNNCNILLHGPSGCGKTLLAEALANELQINFLKVEGPELLSKYIGASELAVRDLFKKATAIKPVIVFFDEFDAIAPRRGHDSTGVTDRVVNQLLTQLDGIEGLEKGVHIMAATSRIDLIDPALLRPGRFNKCIMCPLPSLQERKEIFQVLAKNLALHTDVDFEKLAELSEGFSGADIQAVLYSAQLKAFHETAKSEPILHKEPEFKEELKLVYFPNPNKSSSPAPPEITSGVKKILQNLRNLEVTEETSSDVDVPGITLNMDTLLSTLAETCASISLENKLKDEM